MRGAGVRGALVGVAVILGIALGVGGYTFVYAKGYSYLTNNPTACTNCHIMREQFDGWIHSSHRSVAGCNDCHTPPDFVGKWLTKARNGFWHSFYFTTGRFHEPIQINAHNRAITESACRACHAAIVLAVDAAAHGDNRLRCTGCHAAVGHLQ